MWLVYLVVFVLLGSFGAIIAAFIVMQKHQKLLQSIEEVTIRAEVLGCKDRQSVSYDIYDPYKLGAKRMSIDFVTDKQQYIRLNVKEKEFYALQEGMYGTLTYHANKLISFKRLKGHEEARLQQKIDEQAFLEEQKDLSSNVLLFCDMPSIQIHIDTDKPVKTTREQVYELIDRIYENTRENFFGLERNENVLQFSHDGNSEEILLDIPIANQNASYQAIFHDTDTVKEVVGAFFDGVDIVKEYELEIQNW